MENGIGCRIVYYQNDTVGDTIYYGILICPNVTVEEDLKDERAKT